MKDAALIHPLPEAMPRSPDYRVRLAAGGEAGIDVPVSHLSPASVVRLESAGPVELVITPAFAFSTATVRPADRAVSPRVDNGSIRITVPAPRAERPSYLSLELDGDLRRPLLIFLDAPETDRPDPRDPRVVYLAGGTIHEIDRVRLERGMTLYLEGGAVLRGGVIAEEASDIAIRGRGIIDGSLHSHDAAGRTRLVHLVACDRVLVEGITILDGRNWQVMPAGCDDVTIRGVKIVSDWRSDDGIDLVGCRNVTVERCFIRTRDDCVAIKAFPTDHERAGHPSHDLLIRDSVFWNAEWGNALEIGYETRTDSISGVTFRNCDVIHCEAERFGSGGVLTIHNGDRALVCDVLYEDIRVEDAQEKLVDFKVCFDRYSRDETRGRIRDVTLRRVHVTGGGFPLSILQGFGRDHLVENVMFEDVRIHGAPVHSAGELRMLTEKARGVSFG